MFHFDHERALAGEPLICRNGTKPGLVFRSKDETHPLRVVMPNGLCPYFTIAGKVRIGEDHHWDLFMLEEKPWGDYQKAKAMIERLETGRVDTNDNERILGLLRSYVDLMRHHEHAGWDSYTE